MLPGGAGSLVLVTSRRHLTALEDARAISLDTLPPEEAAELLIRLAGPPGLDLGDRAVVEITRLCGYLPLAIGLLAAVTAAFDLSYQDLTGDQQRMFRSVGLHPGTDLDAYTAAARDDTDLASARRLQALCDQHLLTEPVRGRYRMHDLIREHARALAATDPPSGARRRHRPAAGLLPPHSPAADRHLARRTPAGVPAVTVIAPAHAPDLLTWENAVGWIEVEVSDLFAAAEYGAAHGRIADCQRQCLVRDRERHGAVSGGPGGRRDHRIGRGSADH